MTDSRILDFQSIRTSRVSDSRNTIQRDEERVPHRPLLGECLLPGGGQSIIALAAMARLFDPAPFDESFFLQAIESRVKRCDMEVDLTAGPFLDQTSDLVAVPLGLFQQSEDKNLSAASFEFTH